MKDKYSALWISHSSIGDYLKCPRLYYLRNIYKNPQTGRKINLMQPPLALGQAVHEVVESLSVLPVEERLLQPLSQRLQKAWEKVSGELGGFRTKEEEENYQERGRRMIQRITDNPGPVLEKAVKINQDLPYFWISEEESIILCGKIDWLKHQEVDDSVHIIDFKTGKNEEGENSLQLPIYALLVANCQKRKTSGASYWYLDRDDNPKQVELPDLESARKIILDLAKKILLARKLNQLECRQRGCRFCAPMETIVRGEGKFVGIGTYNQDIFISTN